MKKAFIMLMSLVAMMAASTSLKAQEVAIELVPGWNWIAYPYAETVDLNTALGSFTPAVGDMIKSQFGNSTYSYGRWRGAVQSLNAGEGYHYFSNRTEPVILVFGLPSIPIGTLTVTTSEPTNITSTTAACGGSAVSNDDTSILMKGVCWATHSQPTTNDSYTEDGSGPGAFTAEMTELIAETEYYVRAYAVSVKGINYGEELSFTTSSPGILNGLFSVSENNQVCFSQGNLQYIGSAATPYWKFAEHQWDYIGETQNGDSQTADRDLFGWGTSGYCHGAVCYQPWSTSGNNGDYYVYGNWMANLFDQTGQADWGCNAISNGGNQLNQWRTLTQPEWSYLFFERNTTSGIRFAYAQINNINGLVLLPDNWDVSYYELNNTNNTERDYNSNIITAEQWDFLEQHGAVFLPAAGRRNGARVEGVNDFGYYWTSSSYNDLSCNMDDCSGNWDIFINERIWGQSVRLVRPVQANTSYTIEAAPNTDQGGTITGTGVYNYYDQVTLTANANEGYTFYQWKENDNVVSTETPYSFVALFDRSLEAVFLESSTYPLLYSYNEGDHTATVTGFWDGVELSGELVIPETVMHNGESYTVTAIGDGAFWATFKDCGNLTSVELPNSLISIGWDAFNACSNLATINFPNTLNFIGVNAFHSCAFTEVVIPSSVTTIVENPFNSCSNLAQITVESGNTFYDSRGNCNAIIETATNKLTSGCLSTIIPNMVTSIGTNAFAGCSGLTTIGIPNSVTSIENYAFASCSGLTAIALGNYPPVLGECSFCDTDHSVPVYVPCGSIEAYQNANGWNEFTNFFEMCPGTITVTANPAEYGTVTGGGPFEGGEICTVIATPNEGYFFEYWKENDQIVSTDASYSFTVTGDRNLVANFGTSGFINFADDNVKAVCVANWDTNGDGELSYGEAAAVTALNDAFIGNNTITTFNELQYFAGLTYISFGDLHGSSIVSLIIPENVAQIGNQAFYGCQQLTSINIPEGITSLGYGVFQYCRALPEITLPSSLVYLGPVVFLNCLNLRSVTLLCETPPVLASSAFDEVDKSLITIYVPCGSLETYQNAEGWNEFTNFVEMCHE